MIAFGMASPLPEKPAVFVNKKRKVDSCKSLGDNLEGSVSKKRKTGA